jgi:glycosyltransferase involved in cell wall biosynthesis
MAHRVLQTNERFRSRLKGWEERAKALGVGMTGYLPAEELDRRWVRGTVGVLPYTSPSGASASFSMFAERGIPVVASDLPEFRFLRDRGAGTHIVAPTAAALRRAIDTLASEEKTWAEESAKQLVFARANTWSGFVERLSALLHLPGSG